MAQKVTAMDVKMLVATLPDGVKLAPWVRRGQIIPEPKKRWFAVRPAPDTIEALQELLDEFRAFYNHRRPHRSLGRQRPGDVWAALPKAHPAQIATEYETLVRDHRVCVSGLVTLARDCVVYVGRAHKGKEVTSIRRGDHVTIIATETAEILRELTIDPTRRRQNLGVPRSTTTT